MTLKDSAKVYFAFLVAYAVSYHRRYFASTKSIFVATVRFSLERLCLHVIEESSFSEEFSEHIFMDKYCVYGVKIHDITCMFILSLSSTLNQF